MIKYTLYLLLLFFMSVCSHKFISSSEELVLFSKAEEWKNSEADTSKRTEKKIEKRTEKKIEKKDIQSLSLISTKPQRLESTKFDNIQFDYKIIPHDRVSIFVYKHPELSSSSFENRSTDRGLLVDIQGNIRLPLVEKIHLAGLTQTEANKRIEDSFKRYLKRPDIYFEVLNKRAYVIGEVNAPGEIELLNETSTLLQILSKAGDFKDTADKTKIMILQNKGKYINSKFVNLTDINSLKSANLMIKPNDIVYVLPNRMKLFNTKVSESHPIVDLVSNMLSPFVTLKVLSGWN